MNKILVAFLGASVILNIIFGIYLNKKNVTPISNLTKIYPYLSPRALGENPNDVLVNFVDLRNELRTYQNKIPSSDLVGVYFEYLPSGVSIGINEKENFILASLLKVPMAMAAIKQVENKELSLDQELIIKEQDIDPYFGDLWKMGAGTKITLEDAIKHSLVNSDNTAKSIVFNSLNQGSLEHVFDYLDIPKEFGETPVVTPKNYSSILRSLYLSSFLNIDNSNKILDLLTQSPFDDKLRAGVPSYIRVAHKIGVHYASDNPKESIFTDCGIIYIPKRPYTLCLMSKSSEDNARKYMSEISGIVYNYVSTANHAKKGY